MEKNRNPGHGSNESKGMRFLNRIDRNSIKGFLFIAFLITMAPEARSQEPEDEDLPRPQLHEATPTPAPGFAEGPATPRILSWSGDRQLILLLPPSWEAETQRGPKGTLGIEIKPRSGRSFSYVIDAIPLTEAERIRMSRGEYGSSLKTMRSACVLKPMPGRSDWNAFWEMPARVISIPSSTADPRSHLANFAI